MRSIIFSTVVGAVVVSLLATPRAIAGDQIKTSPERAEGTTVKAPLVKVEKSTKGGVKTTNVKAPFVKVNNSQGETEETSVKAPFVKIDRVGNQVHIRAPFVNKRLNTAYILKETFGDQTPRRQIPMARNCNGRIPDGKKLWARIAPSGRTNPRQFSR